MLEVSFYTGGTWLKLILLFYYIQIKFSMFTCNFWKSLVSEYLPSF